MARQASDGEARSGAASWLSMRGLYAAADGCECQAIALGILARCETAPHPAERDVPAARIAERHAR